MVVHIIHENGPENISDTVVISAINQLNLRFQNASPYFDSTGHAIGIEFCLASIDPQGNATSGITRDSSSLTNLWAGNDLQLKNINRWDPAYYYNIWTVKSIYGFNISVSGYSSFISNVGDSSDGVVVQYGALNSGTLSHECGHYLGLYHTFTYMDCTNYNCLLNGDMVCDTPPDTSTTGCMVNSCSSDLDDTTGFSPFITDANELPNYMDYTSCPLSFSQGQADRMVNSLTVIRSLLLQSNGCGFSGGNPPVAQLSYLVSPCHDGTVYFTDSLSTNTTTVNWDFDNNGIYESNVHHPTYTYPSTGNYTIKLLVTGPGGIDSVFQTIFVQKAPFLYYPIDVYNGIFPNQNGGWNSCGNFTVNFTSAPALSYLWSTGDTTQTISFIPDSTFTLTLTIIDSAGLVWSNQLCHPLLVNVYPLPPVPVIYSNDSLIICDGDMVTFHSIVNGSGSYTYNWYQNGQFQSGANDSLFTAIGYFPGVSYQLILADTNGCYNYSNILYVNSYAPPAIQTLTQNNFQLISGWGNGNQWYLDSLPIAGATGTTYDVTQSGCYRVAWFFSFAPQCYTLSDTICFNLVNLNELNANSDIPILYPVPSGNYITLKTNTFLPESTYRVTDPSGRIVLTGNILSETFSINISELPEGIYFIQVPLTKTQVWKRFIKT